MRRGFDYSRCCGRVEKGPQTGHEIIEGRRPGPVELWRKREDGERG